MLEGKSYCPVLHTRVAEMQGLERLPEASKDLLFPLIVARPWPNAKSLQNTWDRIDTAFGTRRYALDLDLFKKGANSSKPAAREFDALFDPASGHQAYYEKVAELPFAVPVLQLTGGAMPDLDAQLLNANEIDRGFVLRLEHGICANPVGLLTEVRRRSPDVVVWVDMGWTRDLLLRELWASRILEALGDDQPEAEVVVSGSSFPDSFSPVRRDVVPSQERAVFDALVRRHNAVRIKYGDWGSTRAPKEPTPMRIVKRIDLPASRDWIYFRDSGAEGYDDIAQRVIDDPLWPTGLNIWGTYLIEGTADGVPGSIKGQAAAAAARINIHLHRQAHYDAGGLPGDADEPYVD